MRKIIFFFIFLNLSVFADTILNETYTGQYIYNNAAFSQSTKSLSGTSLILSGITSGGNYVLANMPFLSSGVLSASNTAIVNITVNFTNNNGDYDPIFLISDGVNAVGLQIWDNSSGGYGVISFSQPSSMSLSGWTNHSGVGSSVGFPGVNASGSVTFSTAINSLEAASVGVSFYSSTFSTITSKTLDLSRGLRFIISNDVNDTTYRIDSVQIAITSNIPEPTSLILLFFSLVCLFAKKK